MEISLELLLQGERQNHFPTVKTMMCIRYGKGPLQTTSLRDSETLTIINFKELHNLVKNNLAQ